MDIKGFKSKDGTVHKYDYDSLANKPENAGADGLSAYEVAVKNGFEGTEADWLESLDGKTAYEYAKDGGYTGTEEEFSKKLAEEHQITDWNAAEGEPGYVKNRTHYTAQEPTWFTEDATITLSALRPMANIDWVNYAMMVGCNLARVIFDGVTYDCPVEWYTDPDMDSDSNFTVGNFFGNKPEYPFGIIGYKGGSGNGSVSFKASTGTHTVSFAKMEEVVHKLDKKYIPDSSGNVDLTGVVKSVNGETPDENGNIEMTTSKWTFTLEDGTETVVEVYVKA